MNAHQSEERERHHDVPQDDVRYPEMEDLAISIIGAGTIFRGDIVSERGITIAGTVTGNITCRDGLLHIATSGSVTGNIDGYNVQVDGLVEGDVMARHTLTIKGSIRGTMSYMARLEVDPNLDIDGHIHKVRSDAAIAQASFYEHTIAVPYAPVTAPHTVAPPVGQLYAQTAYAAVMPAVASAARHVSAGSARVGDARRTDSTLEPAAVPRMPQGDHVPLARLDRAA